MTLLARYLVVGCWAIFFVYWLFHAFNVKQTIERQSIRSRLVVTIPTAVGFMLIVNSRGPRLIPSNDAAAWVIIAFALEGLAMTIWARRTLGRNWSANVNFKEGHELIRIGPYRFVRHPIYTGFLSMALAAAIVNSRSLALVGFGFATLAFWYKLLQEEALMARHFPQEYPAYKATVKRLIPWVL